MHQGDAQIARLCDAICKHVAANPQAKDSARGITRWWLDLPSVALPLVEQALDLLVMDGKIASTTLIDGTVVFHATQP